MAKSEKEQFKEIVDNTFAHIIGVVVFFTLFMTLFPNPDKEQLDSIKIGEKVIVLSEPKTSKSSEKTTGNTTSICEIVVLKSTTLQNTDRGIKIDAHTDNSSDSSLVIPADNVYLVNSVLEAQNTKAQPLFEVCHKDGIISELKPYHSTP